MRWSGLVFLVFLGSAVFVAEAGATTFSVTISGNVSFVPTALTGGGVEVGEEVIFTVLVDGDAVDSDPSSGVGSYDLAASSLQAILDPDGAEIVLASDVGVVAVFDDIGGAVDQFEIESCNGIPGACPVSGSLLGYQASHLRFVTFEAFTGPLVDDSLPGALAVIPFELMELTFQFAVPGGGGGSGHESISATNLSVTVESVPEPSPSVLSAFWLLVLSLVGRSRPRGL